MSETDHDAKLLMAALRDSGAVFDDPDDMYGAPSIAIDEVPAVVAAAGFSRADTRHELPWGMLDAVGGVIYSGYQDDRDPYKVARDVVEVVGKMTRQSCTPSPEAYVAGGDVLIHAVADWITGESKKVLL